MATHRSDTKLSISFTTVLFFFALLSFLKILVDRLDEEHEVVFTYFIPDGNKSGGAYVEKRGVVKKVDDHERLITLYDGTKIPMDDVLTIDGDFFSSAELL